MRTTQTIQITDLQNKVYDKMAVLGRKENELAKLTKEVDAYRRRFLLQASKIIFGNGAKRKR